MTAPHAPQFAAVVEMQCPECGAPMTLRGGKYGPFYGCIEFVRTGCRGSHGAHPDGKPLGKPGDAETRQARIRAHAAFDRLWKGHGKRRRMSRRRAYRWLQETMRLSKDEAHIGRFSLEQCEALIAAVESFEDGDEDGDG